MLDARIEPFGILADNDQDPRRFIALLPPVDFNRPEIGVEIEGLAQLNIDTRKALAHRGRHRSFESDFFFLEGIHPIA